MKEYKENYIVYPDGKIIRKAYIDRSGHPRAAKELSICDGTHGYKVVKINGVMEYLHKILAALFIPNPLNLPEINHKDENKSNYKLSNLEWCTRQYNNNYGTAHQKRAAKLGKKVYQYDKDLQLIQVWRSTWNIEQTLGYSHSNIRMCCQGKIKTAYGYIWSYSPLQEQDNMI